MTSPWLLGIEPPGNASKKTGSSRVTATTVKAKKLLRKQSTVRSAGSLPNVEIPQKPPLTSHMIQQATVSKIWSVLKRLDACPLIQFLSQVGNCYDFHTTPWVAIPGAQVRTCCYMAPVPEDVPHFARRLLNVPDQLSSTSVWRLVQGPEEMRFVQHSSTSDVLYGDRFKVQCTVRFREQAQGVVVDQWCDIVWDMPLPWTHVVVRHFIEHRALHDALAMGGDLVRCIEGKQFLLPFEEAHEFAKTKKTKVAAVGVDDEEARAVQEYALHADEDAEAVREYAEEEEAVAQAEELRRQDPGLLADLEEDAQREDSPEGKSSERDGSTEVAQMDYFFLSPEKEEEVEDESRLVTILCMSETVTGWPLDMQLPNKSTEVAQSKLQNIDRYFRNLRYDKIILQHDGEPSIRALANSIQQYVGASRVSAREAPPKQHQSQGAVESMNGFVASQIPALWLDVRLRYPALEVSCNLTPWLVRHAAWLITRYHSRSRDKMTPYKVTTAGATGCFRKQRPKHRINPRTATLPDGKIQLSASCDGREVLTRCRQAGTTAAVAAGIPDVEEQPSAGGSDTRGTVEERLIYGGGQDSHEGERAAKLRRMKGRAGSPARVGSPEPEYEEDPFDRMTPEEREAWRRPEDEVEATDQVFSEDEDL
eukprot:s3630_g9.t1